MNTLDAQASCPCGQAELFANCCQPIIEGRSRAKTAQALMRSRYSAHVCHAVDYLMRSWWPEQRAHINPADVQAWVEGADWLQLKVLKTQAGMADDSEGWVEFIAYYKQDGQLQQHTERSWFKQQDGQWYFVEGYELSNASQPKKLGRNDPCPCGSGKKLKRCCG